MTSLLRSGGHGSGSLLRSGSGGGTLTKPPGHHRGLVGSVVHAVAAPVENLGHDISDAAMGFGPGVVQTIEHPGRAAKQLGKMYEQTYSPLLHGHPLAFAKGVYKHPLGPLLDALTVISAVSGIGDITGVTEALAGTRVGDALTAASKASLRTPGGRALEYTREGQLPSKAVRASVDRLVKHATSPDTPVLGEHARAARMLRKQVLFGKNSPEALKQVGHDFEIQWRKLSKWDRLAYYSLATAVKPDEEIALLKKAVKRDPSLRNVVTKRIQSFQSDKLTQALARAPENQKLQEALASGRSLAETWGHHLKDHGLVSEQSLAERPFLHLRLARGAGFKDGELTGGPSLEQLQSEGHDPFYLPDIAETKSPPPQSYSTSGGVGVPKAPGATKANQGILFSKGLNLHSPEALTVGWMRHVRYETANTLHDTLIQEGRRVPIHSEEEAALKARGWQFIRQRTSERIPFTEQTVGSVESKLHDLYRQGKDASGEFFTSDSAEGLVEDGNRVMVPPAFAKSLVSEFTKQDSFWRNFIGKPTQVWRAIVLGLRVGFFTNNVVGNHVLLTLRHAGPEGVRAYLGFLKEAAPRQLQKLLRDETLPKKREFAQVIEEFAPELRSKTFGRSQFPDKLLGSDRLERNLPRAARAYQGIGPVTAKLSEDLPREVIFRKVLSQEGKKLGHRIPRETKAFNAYARKTLSENPEIARKAVAETNRTLGDYLDLSDFEQRYLRGIVPFYSWLRAITKIALHTTEDTPERVNLMRAIGQIAVAEQKRRNGDLPSYLRSFLPFSEKNGKATGIGTQGLNPYASLAQIVEGGGNLVGGKPGKIGEGLSQIGINPYLQGALEGISGKQLFSGADVKNKNVPGLPGQILADFVQGLPPYRLLVPSKGKITKGGRKKEALGYLGVPLKTVDMNAARLSERRRKKRGG